MRICLVFVLMLFVFISTSIAFSSTGDGCGSGSCNDCHTLSVNEAKDIFTGLQGEVVSVDYSDVPGLWQIGMKLQDKTIPIYLDFSKSYIVSGNVIRLNDRKNVTEERFHQLNPINPSDIPTDDALLLGNTSAKNKIIVFTDPHCPYCVKLHNVMKQVVENRPDILFQIKLMPIKQSSEKISKTIVCNKSMKQLETAYAGETVPATECETNAIEQTLTMAKSLGISSTPTLILPNGQIAPGYKPFEALLKLIDQNQAADNNKPHNQQGDDLRNTKE